MARQAKRVAAPLSDSTTTVATVTKLAAVALDGESSPAALEFFAGIGLVRLGLESAGFRVIWANDIETGKRDTYAAHFRAPADDDSFVLGDIADVRSEHLPRRAALAWASFPCIDLSLAGWRRGLDGSHSSTFWHFTRLMDGLEGDRPSVVVLENVVGLATSRSGEDLAAAIRELNRLGYSADVLTLDARRFVPQSRPRLFIVGAQEPPPSGARKSSALRPDWLQAALDPALRTHQAEIPEPPPLLTAGLCTVIEPLSDDDDRWWGRQRTEAFLSSLSSMQAERLARLRQTGETAYRTAYRRTRQGKPVWEIRPDDISGCLRTARGGSSKQAVVQISRDDVRVRWMTPLEYARLMGAGQYSLEGIRRNQALFGFGDAVCVPVVAWLAEHYLMPLVLGDLARPGFPSLAAASA